MSSQHIGNLLSKPKVRTRTLWKGEGDKKCVKIRDFTRGRGRTAKGLRTVSVSQWEKEKGISCTSDRMVEKEQEGQFKGGKSNKKCGWEIWNIFPELCERLGQCMTLQELTCKYSAFCGGAAENALSEELMRNELLLSEVSCALHQPLHSTVFRVWWV